ncbi:hypothetical protein [Rhizobium sp. Root482]|jgi:hypothetical protein|uniref:hypothetical protein n=1 Tax=Rhizobium sp. Root482 TaxID=1736543 RepID=UPI0006FBEF0F|nr:hypothetical protein [Rhizobium sp. Root482]KQY27117.1 hypothetical protein ASD31_02725 [Rhizobium sp. Root482]
MIWILPAVAGLLIVYFAMRSSRFRRFAEPGLSLIVALGLIVAFIIWLKDTDPLKKPTVPAPQQADPAPTPDQLAIEGLAFTNSGRDRSYRATGTAVNNSGFDLDYFRLTVTLEDCPGGSCKMVGEDTALVLARIPAGASQAFDTFFTFPRPRGKDPVAPKWSHRVTEVRGSPP